MATQPQQRCDYTPILGSHENQQIDMSSGWEKFKLLTWKNWLLQYRRPLQTIVELTAPVIFSVLLVLIRSLVEPTKHPNVFFSSYPVFSSPSKHNVSAQTITNAGFAYQVLYTPDTKGGQEEKIINFMHEVSKKVKLNFEFLGFNSSEHMVEFYRTNELSTLMGIEFGNMTDKDRNIFLRFPAELRTSISPLGRGNWRTNLLYPVYQVIGPRNPEKNRGGSPSYADEQFLTVQALITAAMVFSEADMFDVMAKFNNLSNLIYMCRFPHAEWFEDPLLTALQSFAGIIVMLSYVYTCINTVKAITNEKEKQLKEAMKIMGLTNWLHWSAWFLKIFVFLFLSTIIVTVLLKVKWYPHTQISVFTYTDPSVLLVFFLLYTCSMITFCFAVSVFFSKANTASTLASIVWFLSYVPFFVLRQKYADLSLNTKLGSSIGMNTAMAFGVQLMLMFEGNQVGSQWSNIFKPASPDDTLTLAHIFLMFIIDTFLYLFIALYFEAVMPGEFGIPRPWYFIFTSTFWCKKQPYSDSILQNPIYDPQCFEEEPSNMKPGIQIRHLQKVFKNNTAVKNLSLNMYENQITVLLGHNGAGKTTTMSMLTGLFPPTSGTAVINGCDILKDMPGVRSSLGLCPQYNILFDDLTVSEHIYFYSKLKGMKDRVVKAEIDRYISLLNLEPKRNVRASALSGGMKRKLCVGIALCGNSKVVMLDEPSAGMDPSARRALWELLQSQKQGRTILLSTHFMEEADLLGDRIAIMNRGELQCCGSSFFLKKKYGAGYNLIMEKAEDCNAENVKALLRKHIPNLEINSNVGSELSFLLPEDDTSKFQEMLAELENSSEELGIRSYGISLTTLEEVFMKVGSYHSGKVFVPATHEDLHNGDISPSTQIKVSNNNELLTGCPLIMNQIMAMFMKKFLSVGRTWMIHTTMFFLPVFFLIIAILVGRSVDTKSLPPFKLTPEPYQNQHLIVPLEVNNPKANSFAEQYIKNIGSSGLIQKTQISQFMINQTKKIPATVRNRYLFGATFDFNSRQPRMTAWFNNDPYHTAPISLGLILNVIYQQMANTSRKIIFYNDPFPFSYNSQFDKLVQGNSKGFNIAFNLGFSLTFLSSFYIIFCVKERVCQSKHLQFVSGVKVIIFWICTFICDLVTYIIAAVGILITLAAFQEVGFNTTDELGRVFLLMLVFGIAFLPLIYIASFWFDIPATGFTRMSLFSIFTGDMAFLIIQVMQVPSLGLEDVANVLHWIFLAIPHYSLCTGIRDSFNTYIFGTLCTKVIDMCHIFNHTSIEACREQACAARRECCDLFSYFKWKSPGIGSNITYSISVGIFIFILLVLVEYKVFNTIIYKLFKNKEKLPRNVENEDIDVANERSKIKSLDLRALRTDYTLVLNDVTKYYKHLLAVNGLCLGVKKFECFGLLGVNGAGKTTTFKMMTGDIKLTHGEGWVKGISFKTDLKEVQKYIGYCPQFDAVLDDLTARETLKMFCLVRGIRSGECNYVAEKLGKDFDFTEHLDKQVKQLSGGNKRKLSTSIALIGDPLVLYLDEPTTGMDPATKRFLWNALCKIRDSGKCIILTSHSMEECEALCTRLAIMVNGNFQCLGSTQHLKSKFAEGYTLSIKVRKTNENDSTTATNIEAIKVFVEENFKNATLQEEHQELVTYAIHDNSVSWSSMFGILERGKHDLNFEDYSLGQSSLEQVFLKFSKIQR